LAEALTAPHLIGRSLASIGVALGVGVEVLTVRVVVDVVAVVVVVCVAHQQVHDVEHREEESDDAEGAHARAGCKNHGGLKGTVNQIRMAWDHSASLVRMHMLVSCQCYNVFFLSFLPWNYYTMHFFHEDFYTADSRLHKEMGFKYYPCLLKDFCSQATLSLRCNAQTQIN
jgi:hypothetical protein